MKKRNHILAAILAAPLGLSGAAEAQVYSGEIPSIGAAGPLIPVQKVPESLAACTAVGLDGAQIRGRVFSSTMDIKDASGAPMGTLETEGDGWVFKDMNGGTLAKASVSERDDGKTLTVTGCAGEPVGQIIETKAGWRGERAIEVRDAGGRAIARSAVISYLQSSWSLEGSGGSISFEDDHWALDSWRMKGGIDGRLGAFAVMANSGANRRESQSRNRERIGDRPHRGDR
ncbi:MAG: hypothetical protein HY928_05990 [Elusimicrobia bacterium]|nr:hypothetical protein [Elusimicrobiota bacterium]